MRLGPAEGTKEEITGFFQDNGMKASDYFQMPKAQIKPVWLVISFLCIIVMLGVLTLQESLNTGQQTFVFLIGCAAVLWLASIVHLRFKQMGVTGIVAIGGLLLMLVALGVITPTQMLNELKSFRK